MALGNSAIETARQTMGHIVQANSSIQQDAQTFSSIMGNGEFVKFAGDTSFGSETQEKLTKALEGISKFGSNIESLQKRTNAFLEQQQQLNNSKY